MKHICCCPAALPLVLALGIALLCSLVFVTMRDPQSFHSIFLTGADPSTTGSKEKDTRTVIGSLGHHKSTVQHSTAIALNEAFLSDFIARTNPRGKPIHVHSDEHTLSGETLLARERARRRQSASAMATCTGDPTIPMGKTTVVTVSTASGDRSVAVYVPQSYATKRKATLSFSTTPGAVYTPAPLILLYHGLGDNCESFLQNTGFLPHAEEDAVIVAGLCGSAGWLGTGWNAGMCCGFFGEEPDELAFTLLVLDALRANSTDNRANTAATATASPHVNLCVNDAKIMVGGFSNGAMLAEVLACRAPDVFSVAVSVGGVTEPRPGNAEGLQVCTDAVIAATGKRGARPSVLMVHGDADVQVPWGGSSFLGFPPMPDNVAGWVARNGCDPDAATSTINDTNFINTLYKKCSPAGESVMKSSTSSVEMVRVLGGYHAWPERDGFSTTDHIYAFAKEALGGWT